MRLEIEWPLGNYPPRAGTAAGLLKKQNAPSALRSLAILPTLSVAGDLPRLGKTEKGVAKIVLSLDFTCGIIPLTLLYSMVWNVQPNDGPRW